MFEEAAREFSKDQSVQFETFILNNTSVFVKPGEVGRTNIGTHKIKLKDNHTIKDSPRRVPLFKRGILEEEVKRLEKNGLIKKSDSPFSAKTVHVK